MGGDQAEKWSKPMKVAKTQAAERIGSGGIGGIRGTRGISPKEKFVSIYTVSCRKTIPEFWPELLGFGFFKVGFLKFFK